MRNQSIFKRGISLLLAAVMVSSNMGSSVTFASSVLTPTDGVETYSDDFDQSGGYEDYSSQSNVSAEEERAEKKGETTTEKQQAQENNVQEQGQQQEQPAQEAQDETQQVQETEVKKLTSATFDLGKSSVEIYDDSENPGTAVVIYNGETFKNVKDTTYTFTGSTKANSISVMTDREYVIKLKDLSMDGDVPITLWGKGKFNVDVDNVHLNAPDTAMFFAGNCAVDLSVKKDSQLITKGNIGATQDNVSVSISGGYIQANYIFTGGPLYINGGNIDAIAQNAINGNSNLYPVTITGLDSNSVLEATISVDGQNYGYGSFKSNEKGSATLYLPEGLVHISVNGNNYEGQNTTDGLDLEKIVETEVSTEETTESQSEQTEAVETESSSETESAVETEVSAETESDTEALTEAEDSISFGYTEDSDETEVATESTTEQETTVETEALTEAPAKETETEAISETVEETESEVVATEEPIKLLSAMSETFSVTASKKEDEEFSATDTLVTGSEDIEISEEKVVQAIQ